MKVFTDLLTGICCAAYTVSATDVYVLVILVFATGDEMISDTYDMTEVEDGFFYEVEGNVSMVTKYSMQDFRGQVLISLFMAVVGYRRRRGR